MASEDGPEELHIKWLARAWGVLGWPRKDTRRRDRDRRSRKKEKKNGLGDGCQKFKMTSWLICWFPPLRWRDRGRR